MQDNTEQSTVQMLTISNIASFERCVIELVANSLNAYATAIAIRIHATKREIHIVDNGVGIPKDMLKHIAKYDAEAAIGDQQQVYKLLESNSLADIRRLADRLIITSRHQYSEGTFMKAFEAGFALNLKQVEQRPSSGTTVSIYGFHEMPHKKWDTSTICFLIAAIAVTKLEVSFSIRDEERKKVVLGIAKPHNSIEVLRTLVGKDLPLNHVWSIQCGPERNSNYHGYVGLSDNNAMQWIFLNHRPIYCPLILKLIKIVLKEKLNLFSDQKSNARDSYDENVFILFFLTFSQKEFMRVTENGKRYIMFYNMQKILNTIKNCTFQCLAEKATISAITPYLRKTRLLKQIYLKTEKFVFTNDINSKNITPSMMKSRMIMLERRKITSTIISTNYFNEQHRSDNIEAASCYIDKRNNDVLNSIQYQIDLTSVKRANLYENEVMKKMHNDVYKTQGNSINFDITNNSIKSDKIYCDGNSNNHTINMISPLSEWSNNHTINMISPLSEWSNWTYYTNNKKHDTTRNINMFPENDIRFRQFFERNNNQFDFLPRKLHGLLQHRHVKLTNVKCFNSPNDTIPLAENCQHEQIAVHPCKLKQKLCEFRLSQASLKCIKIINQVNNEFIAAWMMWNEMKILLMIDQHAIHERIRYENLLLRYKVQNELLSVNLRDPLSMEFPTEMCNLFLRNQILLRKYGISLGSLKENTLLIRTVPQCLVTNSDPYNKEKILPKICDLLNDVIKNYNTSQTNTLPLTIHNAITSEACHGAIKFGDKLTLEQCTSLIQLLKHTKFPNRCAHGRPTMIPVIEFSELEKRSTRIPKKKLNFASLRKTSLK